MDLFNKKEQIGKGNEINGNFYFKKKVMMSRM